MRLFALVPAAACAAVGVTHSYARADDLDPIDRQIALLLAELDGEGETIVVEGEAPPPAPPSARVIDARAIAATPRRSAEDLLRLAPGLHTSQHASEGKAPQVFLRGFDAVHGADLEIRFAGVVLNEPSNVHGQGYVDLGPIIPEAIAAIAVRGGSFALDQGPFATAGTVDVAVGVPVGLRGRRSTVEGGSTARLRVMSLVAPEDGAAEEVVAAEAVTDRGYGAGRAASRAALVAQTRIERGRAWLVPVLSGFAAGFGEPGVVPLADVERGAIPLDGSYTPELRSTSARLLAAAGFGWGRGADRVEGTAWMSGRRLALDENFTGYLLDAAHGDRRLQVHEDVGAGVRIGWRHDGARVAPYLLAGVAVDRIAQREDRLTAAGTPWAWERALAATQTFGAIGAGAELRLGAVRLDGGVRVDALAIAADDRLDDASGGATAIAAVSPRLRASWRRGRLVAHAAAGRGLRPPEARAIGDGEAAWSAADGAELGATWESSRVSVGAAAFAAWIDREQVFDHVSGRNLARDGSRRLGGELHAAIRPAPWLELRADVTGVDARFVVTDNPIPGVPPLYASLEARAGRGPWLAGVVARAMAPRPLAHGATGQGQHGVDAIGSWRRGAVEIGLSIDNLTGSSWLDGEYHFASWWDRDQPRSEIPRLHVAAGRPFGARAALTLHY